ncbi:MinD/ParA family ATP-binding protein [Nocardiopsis ganjiahuensis]|uniref:MinD/ParA family ATP-binding protein n=1 Tax=Nocardiopsis ganjiahuensis TaxID=239984 RepID=UPI000365DD17|nr:MinD/ParA family protein [Nocardiopsis ganjiahuensis]
MSGIQIPLPVHRRITVLSLKGGVGKTTASVLLGSFLASARESRVVVVDANPDRGTLRDRILLQNKQTLHDLSSRAEQIGSYTELRQYVSVNDARLHALVAPAVPTTHGGIDEKRYRAVADLLGRYYDLVLNDCGTGLYRPGMSEVLGMTDQVIVVLEPSLDSVRSAESTFSWLAQNGYQDLANRAIVVITRVDRKAAPSQEIKDLESRIDRSTGGVVRIPYDEHLADGGVIHLERLQEPTRSACRRMALLTVEGLARMR